MDVTLDMLVPSSTTPRTLSECVESMKANGMIRLLINDSDADECYRSFCRAIERKEIPDMGSVLAAWYAASIGALEEEMYADDSTMTNRQYRAKLTRINQVVFRSRS